MHVLRFQCKMAQSVDRNIAARSGSAGSVEKIKERFSAPLDAATAFLTDNRRDDFRVDVHNFLVTVAKMSDATLHELGAAGITVLGRNEVAKMWTNRIRAFIRATSSIAFMAGALEP